MGEKTQEALKLQFDSRLRLEFHGNRITSILERVSRLRLVPG